MCVKLANISSEETIDIPLFIADVFRLSAKADNPGHSKSVGEIIRASLQEDTTSEIQKRRLAS